MTTRHYRLLRIAIFVMALTYTAYFLAWALPHSPEDFSFTVWVFLIRGVILMSIGVIIAIKLRRTNEHIFFALFLINFASNSWHILETSHWTVDVLSWSLTAVCFIYAMIKYPGASAQSLYASHFAHRKSPKIYKKFVLFFTADKHFWLIFFPALIAVRIAAIFFSDVLSQSLNIFVILAGLVYFRISYRIAGDAGRSRLGWVLWGAVVVLLLTSVNVLIQIFYPEAPPVVWHALTALTAATVCISVVMGVFFAGFLNTELVLRSTIVYSAIFLVIVFLFSFIEHYILHTISYLLHIESEMAGAFLTGTLALIVTPLHNKIEHLVMKGMKGRG